MISNSCVIVIGVGMVEVGATVVGMPLHADQARVAMITNGKIRRRMKNPRIVLARLGWDMFDLSQPDGIDVREDLSWPG